MNIQPGDVLRVILRFIVAQSTVIENVFFLKYTGAGQVPDSDVATEVTNWLSYLLDVMEPRMDSSVALGDTQLDVVERQGVYDPDPLVNTAHVALVRPVAFLTPSFNPTNATDQQYATQIAGTATTTTTIPRCRARKSWGGLSESDFVESLMTNQLVIALSGMVVRWILGPQFAGGSIDLQSGALSMRTGGFGLMNGGANVTNIPGNQVRRKIGRGA